ncbi:MAG: tetratricopeptide repeat protein [Planctomycetes bacterium]|nr:tetratricopeptide repeat protein [Planctomycetota bacterium]
MAQRLNKKLVVTLTFVGMAVIAGAGILLVYSLPGRDPAPMAEKAQQLADEKDYETASKYYAKAAGRAMSVGDSASANSYLVSAGEMGLMAGDQGLAMDHWRRVLLNNPQHEVAQQKIVELLMEQAQMYGTQWWREVQKEAEKLCEVTQSANLVGLHALGRALVDAGTPSRADLDKGEELLEMAFHRDEGNPKYAESLSVHYVRKSLRATGKDQPPEAASPEGPKEPIDPAACLQKATDVYETLMKALEKNPPADASVTTTAWRKRGQFYMLLREVHQAELQQKLEQRAGRTELEGLQAKVKAHSDEALRCLETALKTSPQDAETLVLVGAYWRTMTSTAVDAAERKQELDGFQAKAESYFKQAVQADPDSFDGYLQLQDIYMRQGETAAGRRDKADMIAKFQKADQTLEERANRPAGTGIYLWRNKAYKAVVRWQLFQLNALRIERVRQLSGDRAAEEVKPLFDRLRQIRQDFVADAAGGQKDPRALFMKARLEMLAGDGPSRFAAIQTLRELQDLVDPGDLWVRTKLHLADLCLQIDEPGPAIEALQGVIKLYPNMDAALGALAKALATVPDREAEAEDAANRARAINPANPDAREALFRIYQKQKNWARLQELQTEVAPLQADKDKKILQISLDLAQALDPDHRNPELIATAQAALREVLNEDPSNLQALRTLITTLVQDGSKQDEIKELLAKAMADVDRRLKEAAAATQPSESATKQLQAIRSNVELLGVLADPNTSPEEKLKQTEAIIRQGTDPFLVAIDLYRLYLGAPGHELDAISQLKEAQRLKPDDPGVVELLFRVAISSLKDKDGKEIVKPDWGLAQQMVKRAVDLGIDRSGGHYYQGQLLFARTDLPDNLAQAEKEFREGLKTFPLHSAGYAWLGRTLAAQERMNEAQQALEQALSLNPRNGMAAMYLAVMAETRGDMEAKQRYLEICRELNVGSDWVKQQLQILEDLENPQQGIVRREELRKSDPKDAANLEQLAHLYRKAGRMDQARLVMAECLALEPQNLDLLQRYAQFLRDPEAPDYEQAEAAIRKTLDGLPASDKAHKAAVQLLLGAHLEVLALRKVPNAPRQEVIDAAFDAAAEMSDASRILLDISNHFRRSGNAAKVEEYIRKAITNAERDGDTTLERQARENLMEMMLQLRAVKSSDEVLKEIQAYRAKFNNPVGLLALSEHATIVGRETKAIQYCSDYITATTGAEKALGYYRRASMNYRRGDWDLAINDFREAKVLAPSAFDYDHRILLARCLHITGQSDQAVTELLAILKENRRVMRAAQELFRIYMAAKKYDEAEAFIIPAQQQDPKSPTWIGLLAEVAAARGDQTRAIQRATETVVNSNYSPRLLDTLLGIYLQFKRYDEMLEYINTKLPEALRKDAIVLTRLAGVHLARGDNAKASEVYGQALQAARADVAPFLSIIVDLTRSADPNVVMGLVSQEAANRPDDPLAQTALCFLQRDQLAKTMQEKGKWDDQDVAPFLKGIEAALAKIPKDDPKQVPLRIEALQAMADVQYRHKQFDSARKTYEEIISTAPEGIAARPVAMNNLAYLLAEDLNDPASGLRYAEQANRLMPNQTNVMDTLGWSLILNGQYDRGIAAVRTAVYLAGTLELAQMAAIHYHAAIGLVRRNQALARQGRTTDAEQDLSQAKLDCRRAHELLMLARTEGDGLLAKIVELGKQLGLTLPTQLPAAAAATTP